MALVLHIEDDPASRRLVRKLLEKEGHVVRDAVGGLDGVHAAAQERPDLVLIDINIPDLDGYEVILRLRGMPHLAGVPIAAITAEGDRSTSLAVGADGFIAKPIEARSFLRTVKRFLGGFRERTEEPERHLRDRSQKIVERLERKVRELSEANARLEEAARLRREFLQNVSHELATPMTPVVGYLKLLLGEELGPLTPLQKKSLGSVLDGTQRLRSVVDMLLDVSSLETQRMHFYSRVYDFGEIAERAVSELASRFGDRGIELALEARASPRPAFGDADKLTRAMVHVLDNASKFTPRGGAVAVGIRSDGPMHALLVSDSGPGVKPADVKRVLEPFFQADGSRTRMHGGVGLGLAFAHRVCEAMGGGVDVESPPREAVAGRLLPGTLVRLRVRREPVLPPEPR
jgi:signal transduction histidine kinase